MLTWDTQCEEFIEDVPFRQYPNVSPHITTIGSKNSNLYYDRYDKLLKNHPLDGQKFGFCGNVFLI